MLHISLLLILSTAIPVNLSVTTCAGSQTKYGTYVGGACNKDLHSSGHPDIAHLLSTHPKS